MGITILDAVQGSALAAVRTLHAIAIIAVKLRSGADMSTSSSLVPMRSPSTATVVLAGDTVSSVQVAPGHSRASEAKGGERATRVMLALNHGPVVSAVVLWVPGTDSGSKPRITLSWDTRAFPADRQALTLSAHRLQVDTPYT